MDMKKYIEIGEKKAGKQKELANILGIKDNYLRNAKSGRSGLPVEICIQLADYIKADRLEIIAASNLVTEKDEKKRKIFESCIKKTSVAASAVLILNIANFMTPSTAIASISPSELQKTVYYVKSRRKYNRRLSDKINNFFESLSNYFLLVRSLN